MTVWDTCGQEKFRSMTRQYFKDAHGIILVFDVNKENSFKLIPEQIQNNRFSTFNSKNTLSTSGHIPPETKDSKVYQIDCASSYLKIFALGFALFSLLF